MNTLDAMKALMSQIKESDLEELDKEIESLKKQLEEKEALRVAIGNILGKGVEVRMGAMSKRDAGIAGRRIRTAKILDKNGPTMLGELAVGLNVPTGSMPRVLNHQWFRPVGNGSWELTTLGRKAVGDLRGEEGGPQLLQTG